MSMSGRTKWVVTAAAERIVLGDQRQGEATFTVTNPSGAADQAVFDPVAGEGADPSWFSVDDPQRLVRGGASVSYLLKVAVPGEVPPGSYEVQARVYSVDSAPEESSVLSPRVVLEVPAEPEPDQRKLPWPWLVAAGAVVLVLLVGIGVWVFGGDDDGGVTAAATPTPTPSITPSPTAELLMPDLLGMSERQALATLSEVGLTARPVLYRQAPGRTDEVLAQSLQAGLPVSPKALVNLEVAVVLTAPVATSEEVYIGTQLPTLKWEAGDSPTRKWRVIWRRERCLLSYPNGDGAQAGNCFFPGAEAERDVSTTSYTTTATDLGFWSPSAPAGEARWYHTGWVRWQVASLDDYGQPGPFSTGYYFRAPVT